jgi:hypothetical protein
VTATFQPQSFQPQPMMVPAAAAAAYPAAQQQAQFMAPGMPQQQHAMPGMTQQQQRPAAPEPEVRVLRPHELEPPVIIPLGRPRRNVSGECVKRDVREVPPPCEYYVNTFGPSGDLKKDESVAESVWGKFTSLVAAMEESSRVGLLALGASRGGGLGASALS